MSAGIVKSPKAFARAARILESVFFLEQDSLLSERLRAMQQMSEGKQALAEVSGIRDEALLTRLLELGVKPQTVAALAAVPLIEVAWADGSVDAKERETVLAHARERGITQGSMEYDLLERWLHLRPEPALLTAWQTYARTLCACLTPSERAVLQGELLHATESTARASGGIFGLGSVSAAEQRMLDQLAAGFCQ